MGSDDLSTIKPEKFNGSFFRRWQSQVKYWLTTLGLFSAIELPDPKSNTQPSSSSTGDTSSSPTSRTPQEIDFHCRHRILSALSDNLYDVYLPTKTAKDLWDALEVEYGMDDAGLDRFTISKFRKYITVDFKPISIQIHEFQDFLRKSELIDCSFLKTIRSKP